MVYLDLTPCVFMFIHSVLTEQVEEVLTVKRLNRYAEKTAAGFTEGGMVRIVIVA